MLDVGLYRLDQQVAYQREAYCMLVFVVEVEYSKAKITNIE